MSNDTHIGPRLVEDLRPYCPSRHLDDFDRFAATTTKAKEAAAEMLGGSGYLDHPNLRTPGHHDPAARLADYDHDGVAAGVIFHGSMNMEPIPFISSGLGKTKAYDDRELAGVGMTIYNRWLADVVAGSPHRHIGLAYLPMWDVDAAVTEVEWAHEAGLRGVNFPAMRDGELPEYNRSVWEPLWSGARSWPCRWSPTSGSAPTPTTPSSRASPSSRSNPVGSLPSGGVVADLRRCVRTASRTQARDHRDTGKLVPRHRSELDALWSFYDTKRDQPLNRALLEQVPRLLSEYMAENVYYGASFASPHEVGQAVAHGLDSQLMWGSHDPHLEGTFVYPEGRVMPSVTRLSLRNTFCDVPPVATLRMVRQNAIDVYGLDGDALA